MWLQLLFSRSLELEFTGISRFVALVMALLFLWILIPVRRAGGRAARVNSSDIRNKFQCTMVVLDGFSHRLVALFTPFKQCTLLIQHKPHKTNASGFGLRTNFFLCCKRTKPLNAKVYATGKNFFFQQSQLNLRFSRYKLLLVLTNRKMLEFPLFSVVAFWTITGNENPVHRPFSRGYYLA